MENITSIHDLPVELLIMVFIRTHPNEIGIFGRVCKLWAKIARDNEQWRQYCLHRFNGLPDKSDNWRTVCRIKYLASELHEVWPNWDDTWQKTTDLPNFYIKQDLMKLNEVQICRAVFLVLEIDEYVGQVTRYDVLHLCLSISVLRLQKLKKSERASPRSYLFLLRKVIGYYYTKRVVELVLRNVRVDGMHVVLAQNFFTLVPHGDEYVQQELKKIARQHLVFSQKMKNHVTIDDWLNQKDEAQGDFRRQFVDVAVGFYFRFTKTTIPRISLPKLLQGNDPILISFVLNRDVKNMNNLEPDINLLISHFKSLPYVADSVDWSFYLLAYAEVFHLMPEPLKQIDVVNIIEVLASAAGFNSETNLAICYFLSKLYSNTALQSLSSTERRLDLVIDLLKKLDDPHSSKVSKGISLVAKELKATLVIE